MALTEVERAVLTQSKLESLQGQDLLIRRTPNGSSADKATMDNGCAKVRSLPVEVHDNFNIETTIEIAAVCKWNNSRIIFGVIGMSKKPSYPYTPKSTTYLTPGEFWTIRLNDGRYACGRVLQLDFGLGKRHTRWFLAGLMNWVGREQPTNEGIAGLDILDHGRVHVKTIEECGGQIVGSRPLELDDLQVPLTLECRHGSNIKLRRGFQFLEEASDEQMANLDALSTWGYHFIKLRAEKLFPHKS